MVRSNADRTLRLLTKLLIGAGGFAISYFISTIVITLVEVFIFDNIGIIKVSGNLLYTIGWILTGLGAGLTLGYINRQKMKLWLLAGFLGFAISGLIIYWISDSIWSLENLFLQNLIVVAIRAIVIGIVFCLPKKIWKQFIWLFTAGLVGFTLQVIIPIIFRGNILIIFTGIIAWMIIGASLGAILRGLFRGLDQMPLREIINPWA
jgi:hypothetical protein